MKLLLFSGIALVLLCGVVYAESAECAIPSDQIAIQFQEPSAEAEKLALCDGGPCCAQFQGLVRELRVEGDQCKYCCMKYTKVLIGQSPQPSCRCHYRTVSREKVCRKDNSCWPCNVGDVATIPDVLEERG